MMGTSRRRSRRQIEEDEDEEEFPHSPSTQRTSVSPEPRPDKRRRTRTTSVNTSTADVSIATTNDGIEFGSVDEDDDDDEDEDEEDEEIVQHTQREAENIAQRERDRAAGLEDSPVAIKSIELFNFMCHKRLEIKFGERINFVIGHNGSGKSAILTALTICLGGKANATNRATSLKNLIKEGERYHKVVVLNNISSSSIIVKILNTGKDAYKPELYGDIISIERRFTRDGVTGYKLKSKGGQTISTKRDELTEILDHIQLQVDNPMTILTQDTARKFLGDSSSRDKYLLFMKGVQLSHLDTDYTMVEGQISTLEQTLESKTDALATLKANERYWKTKVRIFERSASVEAKVKTLQNQFAWTQVRDQERVVAGNEKDLEKLDVKTKEATAKKEAEEVKYEPLDLLVQQAADRQNAIVEEEKVAQEALGEAKAAVGSAQGALKEHQDEQKDIEKGVRSCERTVKENHEKIQADLALRDDGGERARNEARLQVLEASLNEWALKEHDAAQGVQIAENDAKAKENQEKDAKRACDTARSNVTGLNNALRQLKGTSESAMTAYHDRMPSVLEEIQKRRGVFQQMPIGPLGAFVKIKKEQWSQICENVFGRALNGFLVSNYPDLERLREILKAKKCDVPVFVSKRDMFDYSSGEPDAQYDTVLRILEISNEDVKRQLIVQNHIESTILIESRQEADRVMYGGGPAKVTGCYALNPEGRKGTGSACGYKIGGARGGSGISPIWPSKNPPRLSNRSVEEQIAELKRDITAAQQELDRANDRTQSVTREAAEARAAFRFAKKLVKDADFEKRKVTDEIEALRPKVEDAPADSGLVEAYREAIADAQERKQKLLAQLIGLRDAQNEAVEKYAKLVEVLKGKKKALDDVKSKLDEAGIELADVTQQRMQVTSNINYYIKIIARCEKDYKEADDKADKERDKLEEQIEGARKFCPERPPPDELTLSLQKLRDRILSLNKQIAQMRNDAEMTEDEVLAGFEAAHEQYRSAAHEMESLNRLKDVLWESHRKRKDRYYRFRKIISHKAITVFSHLIAQRGFQGKLIFDHKKMEIRVKVNPGGDGERGSRKDPKSLSGGEKSFTQICLLLSVWEAMGSPIRALDEFDVFMDAVNRKTSMGLMIEAARHSIEKQFILITPQDMGNVALGPDVRVHRMHDPERGQAVIETT